LRLRPPFGDMGKPTSRHGGFGQERKWATFPVSRHPASSLYCAVSLREPVRVTFRTFVSRQRRAQFLHAVRGIADWANAGSAKTDPAVNPLGNTMGRNAGQLADRGLVGSPGAKAMGVVGNL